MRRTHSSVQFERDVAPKITADQLGHSVDVSLNVYSKTRLGIRKEALDGLESACNGVLMEYGSGAATASC